MATVGAGNHEEIIISGTDAFDKTDGHSVDTKTSTIKLKDIEEACELIRQLLYTVRSQAYMHGLKENDCGACIKQ